MYHFPQIKPELPIQAGGKTKSIRKQDKHNRSYDINEP